jgi:hypothetical protein
MTLAFLIWYEGYDFGEIQYSLIPKTEKDILAAQKAGIGVNGFGNFVISDMLFYMNEVGDMIHKIYPDAIVTFEITDEVIQKNKERGWTSENNWKF